jgi:hypothetical protein
MTGKKSYWARIQGLEFITTGCLDAPEHNPPLLDERDDTSAFVSAQETRR